MLNAIKSNDSTCCYDYTKLPFDIHTPELLSEMDLERYKKCREHHNTLYMILFSEYRLDCCEQRLSNTGHLKYKCQVCWDICEHDICCKDKWLNKDSKEFECQINKLSLWKY